MVVKKGRKEERKKRCQYNKEQRKKKKTRIFQNGSELCGCLLLLSCERVPTEF
jgi:hypothetical protein